MLLKTNLNFLILNLKTNTHNYTRKNVSTVLWLFSSTIIDFPPAYLRFIHLSDNKYSMNSKQAFNTFELGDGGCLVPLSV